MITIIDSGVTTLTITGNQVSMFEDMLDTDREILIGGWGNEYYELMMLNYFLRVLHGIEFDRR